MGRIIYLPKILKITARGYPTVGAPCLTLPELTDKQSYVFDIDMKQVKIRSKDKSKSVF